MSRNRKAKLDWGQAVNYFKHHARNFSLYAQVSHSRDFWFYLKYFLNVC